MIQLLTNVLVFEDTFRKYPIGSLLCIILDLNFPRLVLEILQKSSLLEQNFCLAADNIIITPLF